jgi:hypothetical protein
MDREEFKLGQHKRPLSLRLSTGSLQGITPHQLATLKAEACTILESRWREDNRPSTRSRGRPSDKDHVVAACARIKTRMLRRKKATLGNWYEAVGKDLQAHAVELSRPTRTKFVREWMRTHLALDQSPEGIGPYLLASQKELGSVRWLLIWAGLCQEFPEVRAWLKTYQRQHGALPADLPHEILPCPLQAKLNSRSDFPLGPRGYDLLVRETLRNSTEK